jgi:hypothetical protein
MYSLNYDIDEFLCKLIKFIIKFYNNNNIKNIIDIILKCNIRINTCKKIIIHLETMTIKIIKLLIYNNKKNWLIKFKLFKQ